MLLPKRAEDLSDAWIGSKWNTGISARRLQPTVESRVHPVDRAHRPGSLEQVRGILKRAFYDLTRDLRRRYGYAGPPEEPPNPRHERAGTLLCPERGGADREPLKDSFKNTCLHVRSALREDLDESLARCAFVLVRVDVEIQLGVKVGVAPIREVSKVAVFHSYVVRHHFLDLAARERLRLGWRTARQLQLRGNEAYVDAKLAGDVRDHRNFTALRCVLRELPEVFVAFQRQDRNEDGELVIRVVRAVLEAKRVRGKRVGGENMSAGPQDLFNVHLQEARLLIAEGRTEKGDCLCTAVAGNREHA